MSTVNQRMSSANADYVYASGFAFNPESVYIVARTSEKGVVVADDKHSIDIPVKELKLGQTVIFRPMSSFNPVPRQRNGFRTPSKKSIKKRLR